MRSLILALTVLLFAAPVWADVTITAEQDTENPSKVWIGYTSTEGELIRAFALDITVSDGNIVEVNDYAVGDDNGGYGIFPGSFASAPITVNPTTGQVDNWEVAGYSPVAPSGDPDALGGIGTSGVTIEMGSLYDTAAPSQTSGILCSVTMEEGASGELCVTANAIRGNVVLESAAEVQTLVLPDGTASDCCPYGGPPPCELETCHPAYATWVSLGKPDCWCSNPRQCYGEASDTTERIGRNDYWVTYNDLDILVAAWKTPIPGGVIAPVAEPAICAEFSHTFERIGRTDYWVTYNDLDILVANWKTLEAALATDCQDCP